MINLKDETIDVLRKHGKSEKDVVWAGTDTQEIPLDTFWKYADKHYDNGYGGNEVNSRLLVVGNNWWLERHEYDGAGWWEYKRLPERPKEEADSNIIFDFDFYD